MQNKTFNDNTVFDKWMAEHGYFPDCIFNRIEVNGSKILIDFGIQISGSYVAGTARTIQRFILETTTAHLNDEFDIALISLDHCAEGFDVEDTEKGVRFTIDTPQILDVTCDEVTFSWEEPRKETTPPWTTRRSIHFEVEDAKLPTPNEWVKWFLEAGFRMVWRTYNNPHDENWQPKPEKYTGWYLQEIDKTSSDPSGLFFFVAKQHKNNCGFTICIENISKLKHFKVLQEIPIKFNKVTINSGNCEFSRSEWAEFIKTGKTKWES